MKLGASDPGIDYVLQRRDPFTDTFSAAGIQPVGCLASVQLNGVGSCVHV